jgi:hypothetical protein
MPPRREKRKRIDEFSSASLKSTSTYELLSPDSDEEEEDSESDYSGYNGKSRGRGKPKKGKQKEDKISDDILHQHRSVSTSCYQPLLVADEQFCEKCQRGPADDLLEAAREKKRRSKGKKKKQHEDDMSDEEIALQLGGWLTCQRCVVASHWVSSYFSARDIANKIGLSRRKSEEGGTDRLAGSRRAC